MEWEKFWRYSSLCNSINFSACFTILKFKENLSYKNYGKCTTNEYKRKSVCAVDASVWQHNMIRFSTGQRGLGESFYSLLCIFCVSSLIWFHLAQKAFQCPYWRRRVRFEVGVLLTWWMKVGMWFLTPPQKTESLATILETCAQWSYNKLCKPNVDTW
jgi:hypothetical protein